MEKRWTSICTIKLPHVIFQWAQFLFNKSSNSKEGSNFPAKIESQEIPGVTDKFGLGVQNETGQRLTEFCQENTVVITNTLPTTQEITLHMDITRWSIKKLYWLYFFVSKDGKALKSQHKQDGELTVGQIKNSLLQNSGLDWST